MFDHFSILYTKGLIYAILKNFSTISIHNGITQKVLRMEGHRLYWKVSGKTKNMWSKGSNPFFKNKKSLNFFKNWKSPLFLSKFPRESYRSTVGTGSLTSFYGDLPNPLLWIPPYIAYHPFCPIPPPQKKLHPFWCLVFLAECMNTLQLMCYFA